MIHSIPLSQVPNQRVQFVVNETAYTIEISTRLGNQYMDLWIDGEMVMAGRAMKSFAPLGFGFMVVDADGFDDPTFEQLGIRFQLLIDDDNV